MQYVSEKSSTTLFGPEGQLLLSFKEKKKSVKRKKRNYKRKPKELQGNYCLTDCNLSLRRGKEKG